MEQASAGSVDELIAAPRRTPDLDVEPFLAVLAVAQAIRHAPQRAVEIASVLIRRPVS